VLDYADKGTLQAAVDGGAMRGTGGKDRGGAPGGFDLLPVLSTAREVSLRAEAAPRTRLAAAPCTLYA
jgi:hypothetical protein